MESSENLIVKQLDWFFRFNQVKNEMRALNEHRIDRRQVESMLKNENFKKTCKRKLIEQKNASGSRSILWFFLIISLELVILDQLKSNEMKISGHRFTFVAEAVYIQKLNVPDLLVIDQQHKQTQQTPLVPSRLSGHIDKSSSLGSGQPEISSLYNQAESSKEEIVFECLISFDRRKDKNLIVKWHHDDRIEPIYQWIPELHKRSITPQYRSNIIPIISVANPQPYSDTRQYLNQTTSDNSSNSSQTYDSSSYIQTLEAGFKLVKPSKELGGKYTCSAISAQNDDSKWKRMIVYTPPRSFQLNVSRTDVGLQLANQRNRLIQLSQPANFNAFSTNSMSNSQQSMSQLQTQGHSQSQSQSQNQNQAQFGALTSSMRMMRPNELGLGTGTGTHQMGQMFSYPQQPTTISPQMYSTIDYVNVNQQRYRQQVSSLSALPSSSASPWLISPPTVAPQLSQLALAPFSVSTPTTTGGDISLRQRMVNGNGYRQQQQQLQLQQASIGRQQANGVKLVCDIDQVFPVPEVSLYRLAKLDGSNPDKLSKLDTRIERNPLNGLYRVQVISVLEDDELQMKYGSNEPVYFECLIALTNLELSKYADNKRSAIYWPGRAPRGSDQLNGEGPDSSEQQQIGNGSSKNSKKISDNVLFHFTILMSLIIGILNLKNAF